MRDLSNFDRRLLAPIAVGVFAVLMLVVVLSSGVIFGGGESQTAGDSTESSTKDSTKRRDRAKERESGRATYKIEAGDTLGSIASENDLSVERLQELNPELDPQALTAGQKIKLRE